MNRFRSTKHEKNVFGTKKGEIKERRDEERADEGKPMPASKTLTKLFAVPVCARSLTLLSQGGSIHGDITLDCRM